jgi:hypothetical protein
MALYGMYAILAEESYVRSSYISTKLINADDSSANSYSSRNPPLSI